MGLKIVTPVSVEPISLAEAKAHLRVDVSDDDAVIASLVTAAREECEQILQRSVAPQTLALYLDDFPADAILLPMSPITSIESVQYYDEAGALQTLSPTAYSLDDAGIEAWLLPALDDDWPATREQANSVIVTYQAGWVAASCPASVKAWIKLRLGTLYQFREADSERPPMPSQFTERLLDRFRVTAL